MNKNVNKTKISLFLSFIFMIAGSLSLVGLIYVIEDNAVSLRERVSALAYEKAKEEERYETERLMEETKTEREALSYFVLTEESVIDFITNIEAIASSLQLDFRTETISPEETKDKNFDELSMKFIFSGPKMSVEKMISVFETIPHHSYIRDLSLRQSENDTIWSAEIFLVVTIVEHD